MQGHEHGLQDTCSPLAHVWLPRAMLPFDQQSPGRGTRVTRWPTGLNLLVYQERGPDETQISRLARFASRFYSPWQDPITQIIDAGRVEVSTRQGKGCRTALVRAETAEEEPSALGVALRGAAVELEKGESPVTVSWGPEFHSLLSVLSLINFATTVQLGYCMQRYPPLRTLFPWGTQAKGAAQIRTAGAGTPR
ncbi:hypothetical protein R1flu_012074 [Riccia fluitans]|uniref:Uncharacterized protein n=1 Tax=Riccia fluitans TaxID=41844 RepID=A0ABD1Z9K5_9MARC